MGIRPICHNADLFSSSSSQKRCAAQGLGRVHNLPPSSFLQLSCRYLGRACLTTLSQLASSAAGPSAKFVAHCKPTQGNLIGLGHSPAGPNETGGKEHPPKTKDSEDKTGSGDSSDLEDHPGTTQKFKRLLKCQAQDGD